MRIKILTSVFLMILVVLAPACKKKTLWKGQIKIEDGITVVENPRIPMYEQPVLALDEDLCIGAEEIRPDYLFYEISSIAVDREENIYVTDQGEKHVKVFDRDDCLVLGYASNYTFKILNPEGEIMRIIEKKYDLIPIPDELKKKAEDKDPRFSLELPKYFQPFFNFFCDDLGRLFVLTAGADLAEKIHPDQKVRDIDSVYNSFAYLLFFL